MREEAMVRVEKVFAEINQLKDKAIKAEKNAKEEKEKAETERQKAEQLANSVLDLLKGFLPAGITDVYQFYATRADSLFAAGNYADALNDYKAAHLLNADNKKRQQQTRIALCETLLKTIAEANNYLKNNNIPKATELYNQALSQNPTDRHCTNTLKTTKPNKRRKYYFCRRWHFYDGQ